MLAKPGEAKDLWISAGRMTSALPMNNDLHAPAPRSAEFRLYAELNDFLADDHRGRSFVRHFRGTPSVKNVIEAMGVPHSEIDLILVDGEPVGFGHRLAGDERVAVYPVFERFDITPLNRLRPRPLRTVRFVADVHLGTLARYLRMIGFDTVYDRDLSDEEIVRIARTGGRIILTRDRGLLRHCSVTHGYFIRNTNPQYQLREVVEQLHLAGQMAPFTRCMRCNGVVEPVDKSHVTGSVPEAIRQSFESFTRCADCARVYWEGSHFDRMSRLVEELRERRGEG